MVQPDIKLFLISLNLCITSLILLKLDKIEKFPKTFSQKLFPKY